MANHTNAIDATFDAEVIKSDLLVIAEFWAEWSGPCKTIAPILAEIAAEHKDQVKLVKLDIDAAPAAAAKYEVLRLPTVILFKNGLPVDRVVGVAAKEKYLSAMSPYMHQPA